MQENISQFCTGKYQSVLCRKKTYFGQVYALEILVLWCEYTISNGISHYFVSISSQVYHHKSHKYNDF